MGREGKRKSLYMHGRNKSVRNVHIPGLSVETVVRRKTLGYAWKGRREANVCICKEGFGCEVLTDTGTNQGKADVGAVTQGIKK